jgi:hypothetical protein
MKNTKDFNVYILFTSINLRISLRLEPFSSLIVDTASKTIASYLATR